MPDDFKKALDSLDQGPARAAGETAEAPPPAGDLPPHPTVDALRERFGDAVLRHEVSAGDEHIVYVPPQQARVVLAWLKDAPGHQYDFLQDLTAIDWGNGRFLQVVYQLWSTRTKLNLRVKAEVPLEELEIDSVYHVWRAADWLERETYDMFGIVFHGHPDLRRILMPYNYAEGYPLRKDFPLRGRFTRAEQTRRALSMQTIDHYSPYEVDLARRLGQPLPEVMGDDGGPGEPNVGMPGVGGH